MENSYGREVMRVKHMRDIPTGKLIPILVMTTTTTTMMMNKAEITCACVRVCVQACVSVHRYIED